MDWNTIYNKVNKNFLLLEVHVHPLLIDFVPMPKIKKLQTFKSFGSFNLVMLNQRSRSTTTGQSHNKRSNTCASRRFVRELILEKKNFYDNFFYKPLSSHKQAEVTTADTTKNCMFWFYLLWTCCIQIWAWSFANVHILLKPNRAVLILILNQVRVQTCQKYPRKIVFTLEPEVHLLQMAE